VNSMPRATFLMTIIGASTECRSVGARGG